MDEQSAYDLANRWRRLGVSQSETPIELYNPFSLALRSLLPDNAEAAAAMLDGRSGVIALVETGLIALTINEISAEGVQKAQVRCLFWTLTNMVIELSEVFNERAGSTFQSARERTWKISSGAQSLTVATSEVMAGGFVGERGPHRDEALLRNLARRIGWDLPAHTTA